MPRLTRRWSDPFAALALALAAAAAWWLVLVVLAARLEGAEAEGWPVPSGMACGVKGNGGVCVPADGLAAVWWELTHGLVWPDQDPQHCQTWVINGKHCTVCTFGPVTTATGPGCP